ncbi:hypothetical protein IKQ19_12005 [Candidatus Saccharibacteria bacterium]|nr:hypothetical protein [Candidatus Saccharibacteria bacterium]
MENEEKKQTYLQMIQEPIGRMSTLSSFFKGFDATTGAAILALSKDDLNVFTLIIGLVLVIFFAIMDITYLRLEKQFRMLYKLVRLDILPVDYDVRPLSKEDYDRVCTDGKYDGSVWACIKSFSIWLFYGPIISVYVILIIYVCNCKV